VTESRKLSNPSPTWRAGWAHFENNIPSDLVKARSAREFERARRLDTEPDGLFSDLAGFTGLRKAGAIRSSLLSSYSTPCRRGQPATTERSTSYRRCGMALWGARRRPMPITRSKLPGCRSLQRAMTVVRTDDDGGRPLTVRMASIPRTCWSEISGRKLRLKLHRDRRTP